MVVSAFLLLGGCGAPRRSLADVPPQPIQPPHLSATRFVAFGDTITEGLLPACREASAIASPVPPDPPPAPGVRTTTRSGFSYPARLAALLQERYPGQPIEVINEGAAADSMGEMTQALGRVLLGDGPDVLLLAAGGRELLKNGSSATTEVVSGLRAMIREAKNRGVTVFVATLLPIDSNGCVAEARQPPIGDVILANVEIRTMIGTEGATLVDLFQAFNGRAATLLGPDGFHPSAQGYAVIARTFYDVVVRRLEGE